MFTLNCKGKIVLFDQPVVMGIINATPDSFYSGSRTLNTDELVTKAGAMIHDGATILDVGGQSTRPGSKGISEAEELKRVIPAIDAIHRFYPEQLISVDTFYAKVAREAVNAGASIINDVSAGSLDPLLLPAVAEMGVPYVLMHMKGTPESMQENPDYSDLTVDIFDFLGSRMVQLTRQGINDIVIDVGFGFGKTREHNFRLLGDLSIFLQLERPIMVGLSRKGTIYKTLGITADEALNGTTAMHVMALMNGASLLRVHDVLEAVQAVKLFSEMKKEKSRI